MSHDATGALDATEYPAKSVANIRRFASDRSAAAALALLTAVRVVVTNTTTVRVMTRETSRTPSTGTPFTEDRFHV
jgi:hypothetical protein